ncbi:DUF3253 domain-containing protein [Mycobacterium intermedium]
MGSLDRLVTRIRDELRRARDDGGPAADDAETALADGPVRQRLRSSIRALAAHRGPNSSICPSDAARAVGGDDWRDLMGEARDLARELARSGDVEITQRGDVLDPDGAWRGPIRIRIVAR